MMGKPSRDKGNRGERSVVKAWQQAGFAAERIPLSGSARGRFGGDVSVPILGNDRRLEVKCRATGFASLRKWLEGHWAVVAKCDRQEALYIIREEDFIELVCLAEQVSKSELPF